VKADQEDRLLATTEDRLLAVALPPLPEIKPGDDLGAAVIGAWTELAAGEARLAPRSGDVLVVTQKVVSKAEGRIVRLAEVEPRAQALEFAQRWDKDARQVEVVLRESVEILRMERGVIISRTSHGFVCANAGVDASNVGGEDVVTLLPSEPDRSAAELRQAIQAAFDVPIGVIVSDSFGRPWRMGITDVALGVAGFLPLDDMRGLVDTDGREMRATVVAVADQLASTAELASGKTSRRPLVLIRGARLPQGEGTIVGDVVMPLRDDLFR
jgi:coenzyme F420-0:L-glutamate ligase/coenzyme F420-1:gamma-L-glutamate ligase